jgi:5-methyltetrahydropteroyltriglutamate--homocysteine methyltransferase
MHRERMLRILPTSVIGSYPRPYWLRKMIKLAKAGRVKEKNMQEAYDDAVKSIVREQELAGVDIPSDGEQRRDEMVEYFAERIKGFRFYGPVRVWGNNYFNKPAVVGKLEYPGPMTVDEFLYLKKVSTRDVVKVTITGPYTIADWSFNEYYDSKEALVKELSQIINKELRALVGAGAEFIQIDEPALTTHPKEMEWAVELVNDTARGIDAKIGLHVCYSDYTLLLPYAEEMTNITQFALEFANRKFTDLHILKGFSKELGFGVIDVHNTRIETIEEVAAAIRKVMKYVEPQMLYINPDCGLKLLPREIARKKLAVMDRGAEIVRKELRKKGLEHIPLRKKI